MVPAVRVAITEPLLWDALPIVAGEFLHTWTHFGAVVFISSVPAVDPPVTLLFQRQT